MIGFENVSKFIVSDVTLYIPEGKTVGLIGASGAGKTTLIKLACGLLKPKSGKVYTMRKDPVTKRLQCGRDMSVLLADKPFCQNEYTVADNFEILQYIYRLSSEDNILHHL